MKRDGDWTCFKCKNLNFAFRKICNKCKLPKEESEKNFFDVGQELMKLANLSIGNKSKKWNFVFGYLFIFVFKFNYYVFI